MKRNTKIILYGFLLWFIVFIISIAIYPLHESSRPFFESIMPVAITGFTIVFSILYFKDIRENLIKEGVMVGIIWLAINIIFDLFLFMEGPMKMSPADYLMDIGLTYLIIPIITIGFAFILESRSEFSLQSKE